MRDIRFILKEKYSDSHALVIGINNYKKASPLSYAVSDAKAIQNLLITHLNFSEDNITCLLDEEATKKNILSSYLKFTSEDLDVDGRIIVFFAGHGHTRSGIRGEVGYLVPYDADTDDFSTFIRWDDLTRNADLIRAKHMLFIMDACYGGLALTRNHQPGSTRFLKDMLKRYSRQVLTAGKADEIVSDSGGPIPDHSVFTGHLIEGIQGRAATEKGIITASGLMSYVYQKVANDKNSRQTPHYGYFDGDGDFILSAPQLEKMEKDKEKDIDSLITIPALEEDFSETRTPDKINKIKKLLSSETSAIELHDFLIEEVRKFLSATSEDNFNVQGDYSDEELLDRISQYEDLSKDINILTACLSYWAKPSHLSILEKVIARSTDRLESEGGLTVWINLRWYPLILMLYKAGISSVEGNRFDALQRLFYTKIDSSDYRKAEIVFASKIAEIIHELDNQNVFKKMPGHEKNFVPLSEYLYKILQPELDDLLFIGKDYEKKFDEFEVYFALVVADIRRENEEYIWGPVGRFGWKRRRKNSPFQRIVNEARFKGENWEPLKSGLFGGSVERFESVVSEYEKILKKLHWF